MKIDQQSLLGVVAGTLRTLALAGGTCLAAAGCGSTPDAVPGPLDSWRLPDQLGLKADSKTLRDEVAQDSFPTPGEAGVGQ